MCLCCRWSWAAGITGTAHLASLSSPSQWSPFSLRSEPERERSSPAALSLAHLSWEGVNRKTCHCLFLFNSQQELYFSSLKETKEGFRERKGILYSEQWVGVWNRTHCVWAANVLYIPGSLFFQGFCRFGSLVDNFLSTVLLHVSLLRRHLWLQRLLRLLVTMTPASATLRGQAQRAECAWEKIISRHRAD